MQIIIGEKYNNFTVIEELNSKGANTAPYYLCQCICGVKKEVRKDNLGKVKGCGCTRLETRRRLDKMTFASVENKKRKTPDKPKPKYIPSVLINIETRLELLAIEREYNYE